MSDQKYNPKKPGKKSTMGLTSLSLAARLLKIVIFPNHCVINFLSNEDINIVKINDAALVIKSIEFSKRSLNC